MNLKTHTLFQASQISLTLPGRIALPAARYRIARRHISPNRTVFDHPPPPPGRPGQLDPSAHTRGIFQC